MTAHIEMGKLSEEDLALVNSLLNDLDFGEDERSAIEGIEPIGVEEIIAESSPPVEHGAPDEVLVEVHDTTVLDEAAHRALSTELVRQEAYEEQGASSDVTFEAPAPDASDDAGEVEPAEGAEVEPDVVPEPAAPIAKSRKRAKTKSGVSEVAKAEPKARPARGLADLDPECFVLTTDVPADLEGNKAAVIARRPNQVKIAEKFDNALIAAATGRKPSVYVLHCYEVLRAKGTVSQADLYGAMTAGHGLKEGTARSQAGQIMVLFDLLRLADRVGQTLTKRADSTLALAYDDFLKS